MGVITVSIDDKVENRLREKISGDKGSLGNAISEAVENWIQRDKEQKAREKGLEMLEEGFEMGETRYEERSELHESRWKKTD
jgi:Arc/MetJ-type ribon-helix-helix transcriptional regulator